MKRAMEQLREFHAKVRQPIGDESRPDVGVDLELRLRLIDEEVRELRDAIYDRNPAPGQSLIAVADALADICYVVIGSAVTWGIPLDRVFDAVHASNMTKTADAKRGDGKIMKGPGYVAPDIRGALKGKL